MKPPEREVFSLSFAVVVFSVIHFHFDAAVVVPEALPEEREPPTYIAGFYRCPAICPVSARLFVSFDLQELVGIAALLKLDGQISKCIKRF